MFERKKTRGKTTGKMGGGRWLGGGKKKRKGTSNSGKNRGWLMPNKEGKRRKG